MHDNCSSSSDCCGDSHADTCRFNQGYKRNVCMGATECNSWLNGDCDTSNTCCDGLQCQWHSTWGKNLCLPPNNGSCAAHYEDCNTSSDCCSDSAANTCRYNNGWRKKMCMAPDECNSWELGDCDANTTCCDGLECRYHSYWKKDLCQHPSP